MGTSEAAITKQELTGLWKVRTDSPLAAATFEQLMNNSMHQLVAPSSSCSCRVMEAEIQLRYRATRNARGFYLSLLNSYLKLSGVGSSSWTMLTTHGLQSLANIARSSWCFHSLGAPL